MTVPRGLSTLATSFDIPAPQESERCHDSMVLLIRVFKATCARLLSPSTAACRAPRRGFRADRSTGTKSARRRECATASLPSAMGDARQKHHDKIMTAWRGAALAGAEWARFHFFRFRYFSADDLMILTAHLHILLRFDDKIAAP